MRTTSFSWYASIHTAQWLKSGSVSCNTNESKLQCSAGLDPHRYGLQMVNNLLICTHPYYKNEPVQKRPKTDLVPFLHCPRGQLPHGFLRCVAKVTLRQRISTDTCVATSSIKVNLNQVLEP